MHIRSWQFAWTTFDDLCATWYGKLQPWEYNSAVLSSEQLFATVTKNNSVFTFSFRSPDIFGEKVSQISAEYSHFWPIHSGPAAERDEFSRARDSTRKRSLRPLRDYSSKVHSEKVIRYGISLYLPPSHRVRCQCRLWPRYLLPTADVGDFSQFLYFRKRLEKRVSHSVTPRYVWMSKVLRV